MTLRNNNTPQAIARRLADRFRLEMELKIGKCPIEFHALRSTIISMINKGRTEDDISTVLYFYFSDENWKNEYRVRIDIANHLSTKFTKLEVQALEWKRNREMKSTYAWGKSI